MHVGYGNGGHLATDRCNLPSGGRQVAAAVWRRCTTFIVIAQIVLLVACAAAPRSSDGPDFPAGLVWEITAPNGARSVLLGTIHSEDARVGAWFSDYHALLDHAARVFLEIDLNSSQTRVVAEAMRLPDDQSLRAILGANAFAQAATLMAQRGVAARDVDRLKPWAVMVALNMPTQESGQFLDQTIYDRAVRNAVPVIGIETAREQIAVFDDLPLADQVSLLRDTLEWGEELPGVLEQMTALFLEADLARLEELYRRYLSSSDAALVERVHRRLVTDRNQRMFERVSAFLTQDGNFIAVGALHLAGAHGLLALLTRAGYQLRRIDVPQPVARNPVLKDGVFPQFATASVLRRATE